MGRGRAVATIEGETMHDAHGEIARLNVLLSESRERLGRLESLRVLGVKMRATQTAYFDTRSSVLKGKAIQLERRWDKLADECDPENGKPVVRFAQTEMFAEKEIERLGGENAYAVPHGPYVDRLITQAVVSLSKPAACPHCAPRHDTDDYRSHEDNNLDALIWVRGYLSMMIASGQATDPESAARQFLDGTVDLKVF